MTAKEQTDGSVFEQSVFERSPSPQSYTSRPVVFVVPGDLHLTDAEQENYRTALRVVDEINHLIRPDFVQFIGDNAQEARPAQFALFNSLRGSLAMPHDVLVGDHDVHDDPDAGEFQRNAGATYGVRRFPGVRFVRLNTQQAKPLGLSSEQIAWFRDQTDEARAAGDQVVVFQHNYPYQIWEDFDGPGIAEWRGIVQTRRLTAIVCGHTHYFQEANDGRNIAVAVRSIGDPEGGQPGYLVGYLHGEDLAFAYRTAEETGPFVLVTHPREALLAAGPQHVVCGEDRVRVWIRSESPVVSAWQRIDCGEWQPLTPSSDDHWESPLSISGLSKGRHSVEIEVQGERGQLARRQQEFLVDETGRYTPVPAVRPVVTETQFC